MIISISGKIGSGKDTVGNILQILIDMPHFSNKAVIEYLDKKDINYAIYTFNSVLSSGNFSIFTFSLSF